MRSRVLVLLAAAFIGPIAFGVEPDPSLERIRKDIDFLAGEECEGRGLKTKGILKAGDYIATAFKDAGLKSAFKDGTYFQPFVVPGRGKLGTPNALTLKAGELAVELKIKDDFVATAASGAGKKSTGLVFVGYGITSAEPKYDEYAGVDAKGKTVIILRGTPKPDNFKPAFAKDGDESPAPLTSKIQNAIAHGAAGILFVSDRVSAGKNDPLMEADRTAGSYFDGPVFHVKRTAIEEWITSLTPKKETLAGIEDAIDKDAKPHSLELKNAKVETEVTVTRELYKTRNVVGVLDGAGPLADETVVLGAHYDHLGAGEPGSFPNNAGKTHFGADDNGSGTSGLLELVRRYAKVKNRQGRRIVFIAFSGEEQGLFGSIQYCKEPPFPLETTKFMINMDMIGRLVAVEAKKGDGGPKKDQLVVYGTGTTAGLDKLVDDTNQTFDFKMFKIPGGTGPSDHSSFYAKKIPVLFLFTGTHKDYHKPTDTPDKINVAGLKKVADFAQVFADHYAATTDAIAYLKTKGGGEDPTDTTPKSTSGRGPRIGIMPGNYGEVDGGVLVAGVTEGGPAEKAGIKEDDVIVTIAGLPVKNIETYMAAMSGQKVGAEVEVIVLRKDKKVAVKVVPIK